MTTPPHHGSAARPRSPAHMTAHEEGAVGVSTVMVTHTFIIQMVRCPVGQVWVLKERDTNGGVTITIQKLLSQDTGHAGAALRSGLKYNTATRPHTHRQTH